jgi:hypothetical protein
MGNGEDSYQKQVEAGKRFVKETLTELATQVHLNFGLRLFGRVEHRRLGSATDAVLLPKLKPRAVREHFVVASIRRRDVAYAEWSNIRRFEHFL